MAPPLPKHVARAIEIAIECAWEADRKINHSDIGAMFNCTCTTVARIRRRMEKIKETGIDERGKKQGPKFRYAGREEELKEYLTKRIQEQPDVKQSDLTKEVAEKFNIHYGNNGVGRLINLWKIPHKQSNRLYKKSQLYVGHEPVGYVDAESAGMGEYVDRLGIGASRKNLLSRTGLLEEEDAVIVEDGSRGSESNGSNEGMQSLPCLEMAAMQRTERTQDTNPNELAPLMEHNRMADRLNQSLNSFNQTLDTFREQISQPSYR